MPEVHNSTGPAGIPPHGADGIRSKAVRRL